jgi:hypothetical protein
MRIILSLLFAAVLLCGCIGEGMSQKGVLQGKVGLVFPCKKGPCDRSAAEVAKEYSIRKVIVEPKDMSRKTITLEIGPQGQYSGELEPGDYMVDIDYGGKGKSFDVPTKVSIMSNKTRTLNIDVDLGLRQGDY